MFRKTIFLLISLIFVSGCTYPATEPGSNKTTSQAKSQQQFTDRSKEEESAKIIESEQKIQKVESESEWIQINFEKNTDGENIYFKLNNQGGVYVNPSSNNEKPDFVITRNSAEEILDQFRKLNLENYKGKYYHSERTDSPLKTITWQLDGRKGAILARGVYPTPFRKALTILKDYRDEMENIDNIEEPTSLDFQTLFKSTNTGIEEQMTKTIHSSDELKRLESKITKSLPEVALNNRSVLAAFLGQSRHDIEITEVKRHYGLVNITVEVLKPGPQCKVNPNLQTPGHVVSIPFNQPKLTYRFNRTKRFIPCK